MMTILESKLVQTHVALSGPNEAASTAADDDYISDSVLCILYSEWKYSILVTKLSMQESEAKHL